MGTGDVDPRPYKVTVPDVLPLARHIYARHFAGCCLHLVLDDHNIEDRHVDYCIRFAQEEGHLDCEALARILRRMTKTQRGKVARRVYERLV